MKKIWIDFAFASLIYFHVFEYSTATNRLKLGAFMIKWVPKLKTEFKESVPRKVLGLYLFRRALNDLSEKHSMNSFTMDSDRKTEISRLLDHTGLIILVYSDAKNPILENSAIKKALFSQGFVTFLMKMPF